MRSIKIFVSWRKKSRGGGREEGPPCLAFKAKVIYILPTLVGKGLII